MDVVTFSRRPSRRRRERGPRLSRAGRLHPGRARTARPRGRLTAKLPQDRHLTGGRVRGRVLLVISGQRLVFGDLRHADLTDELPAARSMSCITARSLCLAARIRIGLNYPARPALSGLASIRPPGHRRRSGPRDGSGPVALARRACRAVDLPVPVSP